MFAPRRRGFCGVSSRPPAGKNCGGPVGARGRGVRPGRFFRCGFAARGRPRRSGSGASGSGHNQWRRAFSLRTVFPPARASGQGRASRGSPRWSGQGLEASRRRRSGASGPRGLGFGHPVPSGADLGSERAADTPPTRPGGGGSARGGGGHGDGLIGRAENSPPYDPPHPPRHSPQCAASFPGCPWARFDGGQSVRDMARRCGRAHVQRGWGPREQKGGSGHPTRSGATPGKPCLRLDPKTLDPKTLDVLMWSAEDSPR